MSSGNNDRLTARGSFSRGALTWTFTNYLFLADDAPVAIYLIISHFLEDAECPLGSGTALAATARPEYSAAWSAES